MAISDRTPGVPANDEHRAGVGAITFTLPDDRCIRCGTPEGPLHPGPPEPMGPGVVRDTAVCTKHLEVARLAVEHYWEEGRYQPELMPADGRGVRLWGIRDTTRNDAGNDAWVVDLLDLKGTVGPLTFALRDSADGWISRVRYVTEGRVRSDGQ